MKKLDTKDPLGFGFKLWFALAALFSLALLGLAFWAVITLVNWVTTR